MRTFRRSGGLFFLFSLVTLTAGAQKVSPTGVTVALPAGAQKGVYELVKNERYTATVDQFGRVFVQPLEKGAPVGRPVTLSHPHLRRHNETRQRDGGVPITNASFAVEFATGPAMPMTSAQRTRSANVPAGPRIAARFWGNFEGGTFEYNYTFYTNQIRINASCADAKKQKYPVRLWIWTRIPASHTPPPGATPATMKQLTQHCRLRIQPTDGKDAEIAYYLPVDRELRRILRTEMVGPWAPRTLSVEAEKQKDGVHLYLNSDEGKDLPWQGFDFRYHIPDKVRASDYIFTIR